VIGRLLIANRGEIALRIIRACNELGIGTVAVYSEADRLEPHARAADQAVCLGPPPAADSYLRIAAVIEAALATGADAIHPGYGFLAENPQFAEACADAGLVFVGPTPDAMRRMGSKIGARQLMADAGVPVVPGATPSDQSDAAFAACATQVGYPVLIKASAGGGGKGMRTAAHAGELREALASARHEARAAFGDDTLYLERLIAHARHIEVQLLADHHGGIVHLFERDCSTQRRHQKIIEESPSPALTPALRAAMGEAAVAAARAVGYRNAGTIEFLLEGTGEGAHFYFLEMNTRLQVEHPVSEAIAGVDLVHAQLRVASGLALPWTQADLRARGHAIECRIYAEDPASGFLPQAGRIERWRAPCRPGVRIDAGVETGSDVSVFYDPMLAKLIVHAETRDAAIARCRAALAEFVVLGIATNIGFLMRVLDHEAFRNGTLDTGFLDREGSALAIDPPLPAAAIAAAIAHTDTPTFDSAGDRSPAGLDPWTTLTGWRSDHA